MVCWLPVRQCLVTGFGLINIMSGLAQNFDHTLTHGFVIFNDQDAEFFKHLFHATPRASWFDTLLCQWSLEHYIKLCAVPVRFDQMNRSPININHILDDSQSQPGAGFAGSKKWVEDMRLNLFWDT